MVAQIILQHFQFARESIYLKTILISLQVLFLTELLLHEDYVTVTAESVQ